MKTTGHKVFSTIKDYLFITIGMFFFVASWSLFLLPNHLVGGGVSGICSLLYYSFGWSMGITNFAINTVLLVVAFLVLGRAFGIKTIYAIVVSSLLFQILPGAIPQNFILDFTKENGILLCVIFGGAMTGVGIGMAFTHGGSTGGTDIVAMIINKYRNITPGRLLLMMDAVIICSSLLVPAELVDGTVQTFSEKFAVVIYAMVMVGVNSYTVDLYLTGSKQSVQMFIFTKQVEAMSDMIAFELNRGVTLIKSRGWYHKQESEVLMVVARKTDMSEILAKIKELDPRAFVSISSAMGVYGLGFDTIKDRIKTKAK